MTGVIWISLKAGSVSVFRMMPSESTGPLAPMPTPRSLCPAAAAAMELTRPETAPAELAGVGRLT